MTKKLLWLWEVARELGVCTATVRRLADAGAVEVIRDIKGRRHFKPEAIQILGKKMGLEEADEGAGVNYAGNQI
jgi:predicted site-specific integrase-resolvase